VTWLILFCGFLQIEIHNYRVIIDPFTNFQRINNKARIFGINAYHATDTESLSGWTQSKYAANKDAL
jgi:hypothetical protein